MRKGEYKCRKWELHLKLKDQQLKTTLYIYIKISWEMQTKKLEQIQTKKKKQPKHSTEVSHQITREENKRGREEKRPTKTNPKQLRKWQQEHAY